MSIQKTKQIGGEEPIPHAYMELQQIALGMFLIWDALGNDYRSHELVEKSTLFDWARKHKISKELAIEALVSVKNRFISEPWCHYIHARDFKGEGWANCLTFLPHGNRDVLEQITQILESRPFKDQEPPL